MAILIRKKISEIHIQQAVIFKKELYDVKKKIFDVRFVRNENQYYIFNGSGWDEVELIMG